MNLELKHLAPYLPYKLKLIRNNSSENYTLIGLDLPYKTNDKSYLKGELRVGNTTKIISNIFNRENYSVKPVLKPLTDLFKEIDNLDFKSENKVQFTTYDSLSSQLTITATYKQMGETVTQFIVCRDSFDDVDYWIVEKLIEWHFDVFGLIKKGLAIDINTL